MNASSIDHFGCHRAWVGVRAWACGYDDDDAAAVRLWRKLYACEGRENIEKHYDGFALAPPPPPPSPSPPSVNALDSIGKSCWMINENAFDSGWASAVDVEVDDLIDSTMLSLDQNNGEHDRFSSSQTMTIYIHIESHACIHTDRHASLKWHQSINQSNSLWTSAFELVTFRETSSSLHRCERNSRSKFTCPWNETNQTGKRQNIEASSFSGTNRIGKSVNKTNRPSRWLNMHSIWPLSILWCEFKFKFCWFSFPFPLETLLLNLEIQV